MTPAGYRILVVEDDPDDRLIVEELFDEIDVWEPDVVWAATYEEGVEAARTGGLDVALVDYKLGARRGVELVAEPAVRLADVPVVILTGMSGAEADAAAVEAGAADFLPKAGLTATVLERTIRYAVQNRRRHRLEARFRALIENSRDLITILGPDATIEYASPSLVRTLGFDPADKTGVNALGEVHPEDRPQVEEAFAELLREPEAAQRLQYRVRHADGSWRDLDTIAQNLLDDPLIRGVVVNSWDVTELRRAQTSLGETANLLESTLAGLEDVVLRVDVPDRTIVGCNSAVEDVFGYSRDDLLGRSTRAVHVDDEHYRRFQEIAWPELRERGRFHGEFDFRRADGSVFPAEVTINLLEPSAGLEGGVVGVIRDVTERLERLRRTRFQAELLRRVGQPILAVDEDGRLTYWNEGAEELTGWSREELEGHQVFERLIPPEEHGRGVLARETARAGERWTGEMRVRHKDGGESILQVTVTPAINPDGSPGGRIATGADITELRRAEEERRRAAEHVHFQASLLDAVGQAVIATDLEGRVTYWNRAAEEMYGWSADEVLGRPVVDLTASDASRERAAGIMDGLRRGERWTGEFEMRHREGSTFVAFVTDAPIFDEEGRLIGIIGVSSDITEQKELEEQFRQSQKMEAVGRLAGGVAHDFNNLLTAIDGHSSILLTDLPPDSDFRDDVVQIRKAAERAAALTRQLLAFSRKQVLQERAVHLGDFSADMAPMLRRLVPERIDLSVESSPEPTVVRVDVGQLNQVVLNLVLNAVDSIEGSGEVTLSVDVVELSSDEAEAIPWEVEPGPYVRLTVSDTGSGIPPEVFDQIFEPFFTTKAPGKGTGLGLSTVYGIVKQSRGHITVDSAPGEGTTFHVLLPRHEGEATPPAERKEAPARADGVVVLLVEDEPSVRRVASRVLGRAGYEVLQAADGLEAIDIAERYCGRIDVVLTDVVMPEVGGVELEEKLRRAQPHLRIILMSGYSEVEVHDEIRQRGNAFLPKPFSPEELTEAIAEVLSGV